MAEYISHHGTRRPLVSALGRFGLGSLELGIAVVAIYKGRPWEKSRECMRELGTGRSHHGCGESDEPGPTVWAVSKMGFIPQSV